MRRIAIPFCFSVVVKAYGKTANASGEALYQFAEKEVAARGWILAPSYVRGHRISEFPHRVHSELHVNQFEESPQSHQWVLEIHIADPQRRFGAFYQDILL
ncbi:MAG: hypothetical protein H7249_12155 [Chitinophagaceae bacterium]|nr:hypothetical protein [Oligoflexus sp.]